MRHYLTSPGEKVANEEELFHKMMKWNKTEEKKTSEKSLIMAHTAKHIIMILVFMTFPGSFLCVVFSSAPKTERARGNFSRSRLLLRRENCHKLPFYEF